MSCEGSMCEKVCFDNGRLSFRRGRVDCILVLRL